MIMVSSSDKRKDIRIESGSVSAKFEFESQLYDIVNISRDALFIGNASGFDPEFVKKLSSNAFEFQLVDPTSDSRIALLGQVLRCVKDGEVISGIAICFEPFQKAKTS